MVRVELTQANAHYPLKVACLPFHHVRITLGLQSYAEFIYLQIFRPKNPIFSVRIRSPFLTHSTFLPPRPRSSSAPASLTLVELGLSCAHGTGKAWLTKRDVRGIPYGEARGRRTECAVQAVRFGNVASPVQSSFLGIVPAGVYCQICILKKCCHADCGRRTF